MERDVLGKVVLCLEVQHGIRSGQRVFAVVVSLPGRDGAATHEWVCGQGRLDEAQMTDVLAEVQKWVWDAIFTAGGVQLAFGES
jgi:hypothetical protein